MDKLIIHTSAKRLLTCLVSEEVLEFIQFNLPTYATSEGHACINGGKFIYLESENKTVKQLQTELRALSFYSQVSFHIREVDLLFTSIGSF